MRLPHAVLLALLCVAVYSNSFQHSYNLDDAHYVLANPAVRSLTNIPSFFTDPSTLNVYRGNVDYRPLLTLSYALNHAMGGYDTWWWHLTQIFLHTLCVLGIYWLTVRVLEMSSERSERVEQTVIPLVAATLLALHPTGSGVVNYFSARSTLLTDAFLLPSLLLYLQPATEPPCSKRRWGSVALFTLALFTKVEAVGVLGAMLAYEVWLRGREQVQDSFFQSLWRALDRKTVRRLVPYVVVTCGYFLIRNTLMAPYQADEVQSAIGVSHREYLYTQTIVWWVYVRQWFAPVALVADDGAFPVYRSLLEGPVPLAVAAWSGVVLGLVGWWRKRPEAVFLAIAALAILSPTSSVIPLAEMRNEHRPYLPMAVMSLVWIIPVVRAILRRSVEDRWLGRGFAGVFGLVCLALFGMTRARNLVYVDGYSYWSDVIAKAPASRAHNNFGLELQQRGRTEEAHEQFLLAVKLRPNWFIANINLALSWTRKGRRDVARRYFDHAAVIDSFSGGGLTWRGEFLLQEQDWASALTDFEASMPREVDNFRNYRGAATAGAGLASVDLTRKYFDLCWAQDPLQASVDVVTISTPFFADDAHAAAGVEFFEGLRTKLPETWWVHENLGRLAARIGRQDLARTALALSKELQH